MSGPVVAGGDHDSVVNLNAPVLGGSVTTYGSVGGSITIRGPVNAPRVSAGQHGAVVARSGPVQGGAVLTGGNLNALTIGGPLGRQVVTVGNVNGAVTVNGPVQGGLIAVGGATNGSLLVGGPLNNGQILSVGKVNGDVTVKGGLQGGRIAALDSILGNLTINGDIDSQSAIVSGGSLGGPNGKLTVGNVQGILAAVGPINVGRIGKTSQALYDHSNLSGSDVAAIDALFSQGLLSSLSPADLFDAQTLLDLANLGQLRVNVNSLTVKNGKLASHA